MKRRFVQLLVIVAMTSALSTLKAAATDLRVTYSPANFGEMYQAVASAFAKRYPDIHIRLEGSPGYGDLSQRTLRSAIAGDLPDVSHEGLSYIRRYAVRSLAVALDDFIAKDPDWSSLGLGDSVRGVGGVKGVTYAIPFAVSTMNLFFNLQLVKAAGGDPNNLPSDWDGVLELAKKIDALSDGVSGIYFDYEAGDAIAFQTLVFSRGGSMMNADESKITFEGSEGQWAMNLIRRFGEAGQVDMSRQQARQMFVAGKLGIYQNTSSNLGAFAQQIGNTFPYAMTPFPTTESGRTPAAGNGMLMFSQTREKRDAAWKYIKFAAGQEAQAIMAKMTGYVPVNHGVVENPDMRSFYNSNPNYAVPLAQIDKMAAWYAFPGENGDKIAKTITDEMREVITLRKPAAAGLSSAAANARRLLKLQ
ncbi:extracellular solute-binding protein [Bradyrhizobium sp. RDT10]